MSEEDKKNLRAGAMRTIGALCVGGLVVGAVGFLVGGPAGAIAGIKIGLGAGGLTGASH